MTIAPATPDQLTDVLAILYGPGAESHISHAFRMIARGDLSLRDLLVARSDSNIVGAVFARQFPGSVAVVWPPRGESDEVADQLLRAAIAHVSGVTAIQAFLLPEQLDRAGSLLRAGFRHVTRIWQMAIPKDTIRRNARLVGGASQLKAKLFDECDPTVFHSALVRAHENSLDCPELNQVLSATEVIAGYHDAAPDRSRWWLAQNGDEPIGVLILDANNVMFLGVVPERRGQGVGRWLLERALDLEPNLCLNVDARNVPAIQLYRSADFEVVDAREVFLYFPKSPGDTTDAKVFPS